MSLAGVIGAIAVGVDSFRPSLVARSTGHQAVLLGASAAIGYGATRALPLPRRAGAVLLAATTAASAPLVRRLLRQEREVHADWEAAPPDPVMAVAQGSALAAGLVGATSLAGAGAGRASERFGGPRALWVGIGAGAAAAAAGPAKRTYLPRLAASAAAPDPVFRDPPANPFVSGSADSLVPYSTHTREGARFVHYACTGASIGPPAMDPIRVFVGVSAGSDLPDRIDLALQELDRLGAFERSAILAVSPAGTGYANTVAVEALERMTGGDCATVVIQYGLLPSMFSRPAVPLGAQTYRRLVDELRDRAPRLFGYGESLGAQCAQQGLLLEPSSWQADGSFAQLDAALFVGTPGGTGIRARGAGLRPRVLRVDRWQDLPVPVPPAKAVFLLDHDADPVTRFERKLAWSRPPWLAGQRGRGVPEAMAWRPGLTYLQVGLDVARATQGTVGEFRSHGHDYRADLAHLVRAAFVPATTDAELAAVMDEMARGEVRRAAMLAP